MNERIRSWDGEERESVTNERIRSEDEMREEREISLLWMNGYGAETEKREISL